MRPPLKAVFPPVPLQRAEIYADARRTWERLMADVASASREVLIENYILLDGDAAEALVDALGQAKARGAKIHVVADGAGSFHISARLRRRLEQLGEFRIYHPLRFGALFLGIRQRLLQRTHRRVVVVDGRIGWTGGLAFEDPWWHAPGREPVRDAMVRFDGPAVRLLEEAFHMLWEDKVPELQEVTPAQEGQISVTPHFARRRHRPGMLARHAIARAKKRVWLGTAYFVPTSGMRRHIYRAAERGVDVRLLLPGPHHHDHPIVRTAAHRFYGRLLKRGVRIYEYQPSFYHAKCALVDDEIAMVGTMNMDRWSTFFNHEIGVFVHDRGAAATLERQFQGDFLRSREYHYSEWKQRPLRARLIERFSGLFERWL